MKSHIQMPRVILSKFEDAKTHYLYYVDYSETNLKVHKGHAKSLNTERDYYSEETEVFLNHKVEQNLPVLISYFAEIHEDTCIIPDHIIKEGFLYLYSLLARSSSFLENNNEPLSKDDIVMLLINKPQKIAFLKDIYHMSFL